MTALDSEARTGRGAAVNIANGKENCQRLFLGGQRPQRFVAHRFDDPERMGDHGDIGLTAAEQPQRGDGAAQP
jgi:hypothetical protein